MCAGRRTHVAHAQCMQLWLQHSSSQPVTCPECRAPLRTAPRSLLSRITQVLRTPSYWGLFFARSILSAAVFSLIMALFRVVELLMLKRPDHRSVVIVFFALLNRMHALLVVLARFSPWRR